LSAFYNIEHKMNSIEKEKIRKGVLEITNRVKKFGRASEALKINVDLVITGQEAINYKVMKLFASSEITDQELINLIFKLGIKNGAELLKILALKNEIQI